MRSCACAARYREAVTEFSIGGRRIGPSEPTYFIADIAANHDGDLDRAKQLMYLAKQAGADCAKFQHFRAQHIVSDYGFRSLGSQQSHQATWQKSVFEVYQEASLPWSWTKPLYEYAQEIGIEFMSSPYDTEAVIHLNPYSNAFKVGSGDINHIEELEIIAAQGKPVLIATGASSLEDVNRAVRLLRECNVPIVVMQCNTNYTGDMSNIEHINLHVLNQFAGMYPDVVLGLSDHTPGHVTVLGAVALGARVIEKHFTDDTTRGGPDHSFSMDPTSWREMVAATRSLEAALGTGEKIIEANERETVILQRRCVRVKRNVSKGTILRHDDIEVLRPAPLDAIAAHEFAQVIGHTTKRALAAGEHLSWSDLT